MIGMQNFELCTDFYLYVLFHPTLGNHPHLNTMRAAILSNVPIYENLLVDDSEGGQRLERVEHE